MKILLAHNYYRSTAPSGEDIVFKNECDLLEGSGFEVIPFEKFNDDIDDSTLASRVRVALDGAWSKQSYREVTALIKSAKPDIAHFHNTFPQISPSAYAACRENGVPVVQTLHNYRLICAGALLMREGKPCEICVGRNLLPALRYRCYRDSLPATAALAWQISRNRIAGVYQNLVDKYIALTEFAASRFIAAGFLRDSIVVKPNFLKSDRCIETNKRQPYVVYVGRLSKEKGVMTLIDAWRHLKNIPLKIIGDGPLRSELEGLSSASNLPVEFLGLLPNDEVLGIIASASLQVIPSEWYEGFPVVILEAYALGVPVVASRIGSLDEIVIEEETGLKFEAGNARDLADKIGSLFCDPTLMGNMQRQARRVFELNYTAEANVELLGSIYADAIFHHRSK